jgi:hypothetical protein
MSKGNKESKKPKKAHVPNPPALPASLLPKTPVRPPKQR